MTSYDARQANQGIPDDEVLQFSIQESRTVITFNRDDFVKLHWSGIRHCGLIICKDDRNYNGQAEVLQDWFAQNDSLNDRCLRVKKQNQSGARGQRFVVQEYDR